MTDGASIESVESNCPRKRSLIPSSTTERDLFAGALIVIRPSVLSPAGRWESIASMGPASSQAHGLNVIPPPDIASLKLALVMDACQ